VKRDKLLEMRFGYVLKVHFSYAGEFPSAKWKTKLTMLLCAR
jgi:hypothetical protein